MKKILYILGCIMLLITITTYSVLDNKKTYADQTIDLTCKSAFLIDYDSDTIIFEKEKDKKLPIASMVKLMTIYLTFDSVEQGILKYDQKIISSELASSMGGSQVFIDPFCEYSVEDLLKSVIISSANDASVVLAEAISGSVESFVEKMNTTANDLGMKNTLYCNPTGLPAPQQYSTAYDCAILMKNILKFEDYHKYSTIWLDSLIHPSGRKTELVNTNKLIRYYDGCDSGKTGSTNEAGYCLTSSAKRGNMRLISVIIGCKTGKDRFKEATTLLNYGFANYTNKQLLCTDNVVKEMETTKCKSKNALIVPKENYYAFDKKGKTSNYEINYELPEKISPCKAGAVVGKAIITKDGNVVKVVDLTVKETLEAISFKDSFKNIIKAW